MSHSDGRFHRGGGGLERVGVEALAVEFAVAFEPTGDVLVRIEVSTPGPRDARGRLGGKDPLPRSLFSALHLPCEINTIPQGRWRA
jgi:hypothetical protein